ncbi:MAG: Uma2 family endonuclease [Gemmataceae bacterium]|nr:Uma2 family endonuclease [Gemmataceae bacterium]
MATVQSPVAEQRVVLENVPWQTYETLLRDLDGRQARLTYDNGMLEIMTLSHAHESYGAVLRRLIEALAEELDQPIHSGGSTTFHREALKQGLEPDECYWLRNERPMRGKKHFDITTDPPPDLALEVELSPPALDRMAIYAGLGVPEIWRFDGEQLRVYQLGTDGKYRLCEQSLAFPELPLEEIVRFVRESDTQEETRLVKSFRKWVREELLPIWGKAKRPARKRQDEKRKRKPK